MGNTSNNTTVGEVVEAFSGEDSLDETRVLEYANRVIDQLPSTVTEDSMIETTSSAVTAGGIAENVRLATSLVNDAASSLGVDDELTLRSYRSLASASDLLGVALDNINNNLSPEEAETFTREFLDHHDLRSTVVGGERFFIQNLDEKTAKSGDYVPKPEAFAPGNMLEQNQSAVHAPSSPLRNGPGGM